MVSTEKGVPGPAAGARLPALSLAVPAAMEMLNVPLPVMLLMVTVLLSPEPWTLVIVPFAVPVLFKVISPASSVFALKFVSAYVIVYVTGPLLVLATLGAPISIVGAMVSKITLLSVKEAFALGLPAIS